MAIIKFKNYRKNENNIVRLLNNTGGLFVRKKLNESYIRKGLKL